LAKGFAAPLAVVGGSASDIAQFEAASETRMHTSPPTLADLRAAEAGLYHNRDRGERLRGHLWDLVARFRRDFGALGVQLAPTIFPIQGIRRGPQLDLPRLHQRLQARGVRTVLRRSVCANVPEISFLLTAAHSFRDIHEAARAVAAILAEPASVGWANSLGGAP
jgi:8-amino-7-oxononanoate synthase